MSEGKSMVKRGVVFLTGVCLFIGGLIVPFVISIIMGLWGGGVTDRRTDLTHLFTAGVSVSLLLGIPLIVIGILMRSKRRDKSS